MNDFLKLMCIPVFGGLGILSLHLFYSLGYQPSADGFASGYVGLGAPFGAAAIYTMAQIDNYFGG